MDPGAGPDSSLTVNEQVIVMSGHETIRVLEVGVDAQIPAEEEGKALEAVATEGSQSGGPAEAGEAAGEAGPDNPDSSVEATVKSLPGMPSSPAPAVATFSQAPCQPQASQTLTPLAVQAAPQYCRSSGWSTGAGRVDNSYCNRGCPPRTDRCFSHGGNFQATFSRSPSSCRAEHRSPGACTSRPTSPALLACPAPTTGPAPDAVPAPATAADHTGHSTAAHCCHRHCPHPQVCGHPHTDHRSACRLRIQPGNHQCCLPRGTDPDPGLPHHNSGHCQRHSQHARDQQSDSHQRSGSGKWSKPGGGVGTVEMLAVGEGQDWVIETQPG
uniref:POU class 6 homeobox 1 n=1 Tax=Bos indicus x Bos taurus TaxID=30522 RepID=A0A4W2ENN3_BOBOX